jgi:hypothetical protein
MDEMQALKARLRELEQAEEVKAQALRDSVQPVYEFLLEPEAERNGFFGGDRLFDDTCRFYKLSGRVTNKEELKEVGAGHRVFEGAMRYLFNGATGQFACAVGGGSVFLSSQEGWRALSDFIRQHPEGGNVSDIVSYYRGSK